MSVSDAAPLPRLGEVFFDVRGNSRSMRLSWYADTGVAVFSIWQAGMCTGTFRLPIGDLQRMIGILEHGPAPAQGRERPPVTGSRRGPGQDPGGYPPAEDELGLLDSATGPAGYASPGQHGQNGLSAPYGAGDEGTAGYPAADYDAGYPDAGYGRAGSGRADSGRADGGRADSSRADSSRAGQGSGGYGQDGYLPADGARAADYAAAADDYGTGGYVPADYRAGGNPPADYGAGHDASRRGPDIYGVPGGRDYRQGDYPPGDQAGGRSSRSAGHDGGDYPTSGYGLGTPDYATSEHPTTGHRGASRAAENAAYPAAGYGSHRDDQAGGHRSSSGLGPDPGGQALAGPAEASHGDERFVPPYVRGSDESYRTDRRPEAGSHERDLGDRDYPEDRPSVWPPEDYVEPPWPQETYSNGGEYRHR